ncbi:MAG TPA: carboxypeptidase regulatory-like domain-containing protein [Acidobacteriaceae bacterium]|jgi:hypothetical protein|nr:carboxypeptidase regulatory-like domain-containing protein [Acidobacteriaceae bacterium]
MKKLLLIALFGSSSLLFSQTVCNGAVEQCREAQRRVCASEKAPANLKLSGSRIVEGEVIDQTGAKFAQVVVQLRSPSSDQVLRTATASDGEFDFGELPAGSYRLIVLRMEKSGPERLKMFDQPVSLLCAGSIPQCRLSVIPKLHGTDDPIDSCPPK